jgi:phage terminase large subunit-like protein
MHAPPPRFITKGDSSLENDGRQLTRLSRALGKPYMPWQQLVATRATERTRDGMFKYKTVLVTVPRQSGKTTMMTPVQVHRMMTRPNSSSFYTAQTGKDAGKRMQDTIKLVMGSALAPLFQPRYAAGSQGLTLGNGAQLRTFAPGPAALHGETPHLVTLDEIWKWDDVQGTQMMGAIGPAQATLEGEAQLWLISTMGTAESAFMNEWVEKGRSGSKGLFYAEWSADPDLDPYEPKTWWSFHPALGNTIGEGVLVQEANDQPMGEWMRAYMNRLTEASDPLIPAEDWAALVNMPAVAPARSTVWLSYEVGESGVDATVMANWRDESGMRYSRVLHHAPGTAWLVPFLLAQHEGRQWAGIAADDGGETRPVTDELRRAGVVVYTVGMSDFATASVGWLTDVRGKRFGHAGERSFAAAVARAVLQRMGDSWRFSRKNSAGSISGVIASVAGQWAFDHAEVQPTEFMIYS